MKKEIAETSEVYKNVMKLLKSKKVKKQPPSNENESESK